MGPRADSRSRCLLSTLLRAVMPRPIGELLAVPVLLVAIGALSLHRPAWRRTRSRTHAGEAIDLESAEAALRLAD